MKKTMKMTIGFLMVLLLAFAVISCGGSSSGKLKLNVLNYADLTAPNAAETKNWTFNTFKQRNTDVDLEIEDLYDEAFHNKTEAYAASGNMPDVLYVWPSGRSTSLHQNRLLKDLGPLIARDNLRGSYLPAAMDPNQQASKYQAMIPLTITNTHMFFVNMEVLNDCGLQIPKTYAELKAQVPVLRAKGYDTVVMANMDTWVMQSCLFSMLAGRFCGEGWHERILSGQAKFTDPDFVAALQFVKTLYDDGVLNQNTLGLGYGDVPGMFATNKCAYLIDGDWRVGAFLTDPSTNQALIEPARQGNIKLTVFPDIEGAKINKTNSSVLGTGWAMSAAIPAGSDKEDAAWRLIKWLTGVEVQTRGLETGAYSITANTGVNPGALNLEPMQIQGASDFGKEFSVATCVIDGEFHSDIFNPLNDGLQEIGLGSKTPQQVAADTQRNFDTAKAAGLF